MQVAMSEQPIDVKAPAQSCMNYLRNWSKEHGKPFENPSKSHNQRDESGEVHTFREESRDLSP